MNQKGFANIALILIIVVIVGAIGYFGFIRKYCEEIAPPKMGQQDYRIVQVEGKIYFCHTFFDKFQAFVPYSQESQNQNTTNLPAPKSSTTNKIISDTAHKISSVELTKTRELFEKNKLDINGLRFTHFRADDENQTQAIYEIHISANQFYNGLPIFLGNNTYHFNKLTGVLDSISGKRITNLSISITPKISVDEAAKKSGVKSTSLSGELGIYSVDKNPSDLNPEFEYVLAWKITPRESQYPVAFVDAITGSVLYYFDGIIN